MEEDLEKSQMLLNAARIMAEVLKKKRKELNEDESKTSPDNSTSLKSNCSGSSSHEADNEATSEDEYNYRKIKEEPKFNYYHQDSLIENDMNGNSRIQLQLENEKKLNELKKKIRETLLLRSSSQPQPNSMSDSIMSTDQSLITNEILANTQKEMSNELSQPQTSSLPNMTFDIDPSTTPAQTNNLVGSDYLKKKLMNRPNLLERLKQAQKEATQNSQTNIPSPTNLEKKKKIDLPTYLLTSTNKNGKRIRPFKAYPKQHLNLSLDNLYDRNNQVGENNEMNKSIPTTSNLLSQQIINATNDNQYHQNDIDFNNNCLNEISPTKKKPKNEPETYKFDDITMNHHHDSQHLGTSSDESSSSLYNLKQTGLLLDQRSQTNDDKLNIDVSSDVNNQLKGLLLSQTIGNMKKKLESSEDESLKENSKIKNSITNKVSSYKRYSNRKTCDSSSSTSSSSLDKSKNDLKKDELYWERRRKNNEAAKRSRDARRMKEDEIALRAAILEQENLRLKVELKTLQQEFGRLKNLLISGNSSNGRNYPSLPQY
ncbi:hypothetical protein SNEBB_010206 [Seison nebaliae]|nr:hypothetical protein SNEBB_010206 [Seison nebaliae]